MILVTVGTHGQGFDRLVKAMDELAADLEEPVVLQRGSSPYIPEHARHFDFTSGEHMEQLTREARIVVSHAAAGSILVALRQGKPLVVVPRLSQFGEVIDDHQQQLAMALAAEGKAVAVHDPSVSTLRVALTSVTRLSGHSQGPTELTEALRQQLAYWATPTLRRGEPPIPIRKA